MSTATQKRIDAAQKKYDGLAAQSAAHAKEMKKLGATIEATVKADVAKQMGAKVSESAKLKIDKTAAHSELVAAKDARFKEITEGVTANSIQPADAKAELIELGHTAASADIEITRAQGKPLSLVAPSPQSEVPTAPLPETTPAKPGATSVSTRVDDPISSQKSASEAVVYKDPPEKK